MSNFKSMVQGTPAWHEKYNGDVGLIFPKTASYASGVFTVQELPAYDSESSPAQFPLSFAAPATFTRGDRLRVWSKDIELLDSGLKPLKNAAFKAEAIVALNVDYPAGRAFLVAGGSGAVGVLPAQTAIVVIAADRSANVTLTNPGGSAYAGTRLVVKQGNNIPEDEEDGTVLDAGKATAYTVQGLTNGLPYVIRAFAYNSDGDFQSDTTGAVESFTPSDLPTDPPGNVLSFKATAGNKFVILTWMDPADSTYTTWAGTMIRRKLGGYPVDETDGQLVVDSKIRNQYQSQGFLDEGLSNTETYFYQAFPYSTAGMYNRSEANRVEASPRPTEFEWLTAATSSFTWTVPETGWYKILGWGACGRGGNGAGSASRCSGGGGAGAGSGGFFASILYFEEGETVPFVITAERTEAGSQADPYYMYATNGKNGADGKADSSAAPGGVGGVAVGGNLANVMGYTGGYGGRGYEDGQNMATEAQPGGNDGASPGILPNPNKNGGPGGGGARVPGSNYCRYVIENMGLSYKGGNSSNSYNPGGNGSSVNTPVPGVNMVVVGAGSGAAGGILGGSGPSWYLYPGGIGGTGQGGVVIIEQANESEI